MWIDAFAGMVRKLPYCLCLLVLGTIVSLAEASDPTVCAVIKAAASGDISTGAQELLEQRLLAAPGITLVERTLIDQILKELALTGFQENLDIGKRLRLGELLKADLLVFLFESEKNKETVVSVRVAESNTGLQLAAETFLWDKREPEATVTSLLGAVSTAEERRKAGIRAVVAVPPLDCTDRSPSQAHWRRPLATLLQERLLAHKGILVVELDEARAFATEFFIGKQAARLQHSLPFYLLGKYSTEITERDLSFSLDLALQQEDKEILGRTLSHVRQADLSTDVARAADEIAEQLVDSDHDAAAADPIKEAALLMTRANLFRKLGDFDVALPLCETVILLDPTNLDARVCLVSVLHSLVDLKYRKYVFSDPSIPKEYSQRFVWVADRGIEHLAYLGQHAPLSESVITTLYSFRQSVWPLRYWVPRNPGNVEFRAQYLRFCRRREAAYLQFISRFQAEGTFDRDKKGYLIREFGFLVSDAVASDPEAAIASMRQMMAVVREEDKAVPMMVRALAAMGVEADRVASAAYGRFLAELLASNRRDLQTVGKFGRILSRITNPETKQKAWAEIEALEEWKQLADWEKEWIEVAAQLCMEEHLRQDGTLRAEQEKKPSVFIPHLELVSVSLDGVGALAKRRVFDWVNCEKHGDCIATDKGIFLSDGRSARRVSELVVDDLAWDGRWIWGTILQDIHAIEPQTGRVVTFRDDLGHRVFSFYMFCPIKPGTIAAVGFLRGVDRATRTWVWLLTIADDGVSKNARVIYDAREQPDETENHEERWAPKEAFRPLWALTLDTGPAHQTPVLVIGRGETQHVQPLVINLEDHSATILRTLWPGFHQWRLSMYPWAIWHHDTLYLALGAADGAREWSGVFQTRDLDTVPEMFANFGVRLRAEAGLWDCPYFDHGVVHDNVLHLMTRFSHQTPNWVAVDLQTRETYQLVASMKLVTSTKGDYEGWQLVPASGQRLVLLHNLTAYWVTLPDRKTWPRFPEGSTNESMLLGWPFMK